MNHTINERLNMFCYQLSNILHTTSEVSVTNSILDITTQNTYTQLHIFLSEIITLITTTFIIIIFLPAINIWIIIIISLSILSRFDEVCILKRGRDEVNFLKEFKINHEKVLRRSEHYLDLFLFPTKSICSVLNID
jgi:hypothetical protein